MIWADDIYVFKLYFIFCAICEKFLDLFLCRKLFRMKRREHRKWKINFFKTQWNRHDFVFLVERFFRGEIFEWETPTLYCGDLFAIFLLVCLPLILAKIQFSFTLCLESMCVYAIWHRAKVSEFSASSSFTGEIYELFETFPVNENFANWNEIYICKLPTSFSLRLRRVWEEHSMRTYRLQCRKTKSIKNLFSLWFILMIPSLSSQNKLEWINCLVMSLKNINNFYNLLDFPVDFPLIWMHQTPHISLEFIFLNLNIYWYRVCRLLEFNNIVSRRFTSAKNVTETFCMMRHATWLAIPLAWRICGIKSKSIKICQQPEAH